MTRSGTWACQRIDVLTIPTICVHCALQACRNLGISHDGIRHEYVMEYAMMELQQWAEIDRLGALRGL